MSYCFLSGGRKHSEFKNELLAYQSIVIIVLLGESMKSLSSRGNFELPVNKVIRITPDDAPFV